MIRRHTSSLLGRTTLVVAVIGAVLAMASTAFANVPITTVSTDPYTNTPSYPPDRGGARHVLVRLHHRGGVPGRPVQRRRRVEHRVGHVDQQRGQLDQRVPARARPSTRRRPGTWARISDPAVAYDAKHNVWMSERPGDRRRRRGKAMLVNRSTDGGLTWRNPVTVSHARANFYDKKWIACDNTATSPFYGNCYVGVGRRGAGNHAPMAGRPTAG